jgi:(2S)-methylsuccinyl-CoA dehydrogenase
VVEAAASVLGRLEAIRLDLGVPSPRLHELADSDAFLAARRGAATSQALSRLGQAVIESPELLDLPVAEDDIAMARDAFARFAAEVVAPIAQDIHRQDLTVPESLLRPLREMGVFGLSIPLAFGGSASGSVHDNALMIAVTEALSEASLAAAGTKKPSKARS